jgi:positive regulator of sigma E activity
MPSEELIEHSGTVTAVTDNGITVMMERQSACGSCVAKSACGLAGDEVKVFNVKKPVGKNVAVGDNVTVVMKSSLGLTAVFLSYVIPLIVLLGLLLTLLKVGVAEPLAALYSVLAVAAYYLVLYFFRDRLKRKFEFVLKD